MFTLPLLRNAYYFLWARVLCGAICAAISFQPITAFGQRSPSLSATVTVSFTPDHPANRFVPARTLGAGVDGHTLGETDRQLSPANIQAMLSAGLKPLT